MLSRLCEKSVRSKLTWITGSFACTGVYQLSGFSNRSVVLAKTTVQQKFEAEKEDEYRSHFTWAALLKYLKNY